METTYELFMAPDALWAVCNLCHMNASENVCHQAVNCFSQRLFDQLEALVIVQQPSKVI